MLKLIETVWRTKLTFYFQPIRKLKIVRKYTGSRPIAPQLLSCDQNNSQIRDPRQISGGTEVFQTKSMRWPKKFFPELVQRFLRFSTIFGYFLWKHELYPILHKDHENRVLFCISSMVTQLQPHLETGSKLKTRFVSNESGFLHMSNELCYQRHKRHLSRKSYLESIV